MTRRSYIIALESIRNAVNNMGKEYKTIILTDATDMERDRAIKTAKMIRNLCDRFYEDIAISTKVMVDKAATGEQEDLFDETRKP